MNAELNGKLQHQTTELDDIKTAAAVAESIKLDEIDSERRRCAEEVATLQQLMKGMFYCAASCTVLNVSYLLSKLLLYIVMSSAVCVQLY